jgi:hypothetical protein
MLPEHPVHPLLVHRSPSLRVERCGGASCPHRAERWLDPTLLHARSTSRNRRDLSAAQHTTGPIALAADLAWEPIAVCVHLLVEIPDGLLCPGPPPPRCGTRRFTTRVAQVRAAAAPCRRFTPPNAGDYATSPWHRAVAWRKETHEQKQTAWTGTRRSQASVVLGRSSGRLPAAGTTRRGKIPYRSGILTTCT